MSTGSYTISLLIGLFLVILFAVISVFVWVWAVRRPPQAPPQPEAVEPELQREPSAPVYAALGLANVQSLFHADTETGDCWPDLLHNMMPVDTEFVKLGERENTLHETNEHSLPVAVRSHPTVLTLWQAAGDATGGTALTTYLQELRDALRLLVEETDATIFLLNLPDLSLLLENASEERKALVRGGVEQWNRVIAQVSMPHGNRVRLVDLYPSSAEVLDMKGGNAALANLVWREMEVASS
jgi:hypothetical protein